MQDSPTAPSTSSGPSERTTPTATAQKPSAISNVFRSWTKNIKTTYNAPTSGDSAPVALVSGINQQALFEKLAPGSSNANRIVAANDLTDMINKYSVPSAIEGWYLAQDMLASSNPKDMRHAALNLLIACIRHDMSESGSAVNKLDYYRTLAEHQIAQDFDLQLKAFKELTKNGRELPVLGPAESPLVLMLSSWLRSLFKDVTTARMDRSGAAANDGVCQSEASLRSLSAYIINVIKFNFYAFDDKDIVTFIQDILYICRKSPSRNDIIDSITLISTLTIYGNLPISMLEACTETLCGASIVVPELEKQIWEAIIHLLNSHLANNVIVALYNILREATIRPDITLNTIKGSILFLHKLLEEEPASKPNSYDLTIISVMISFKAVMELSLKNKLNTTQIDFSVMRAMHSILTTPRSWSIISYDDWQSENSPLNILLIAARSAVIPAPNGFTQLAADSDEPGMIMSQFLREILQKLKLSISKREYNGPRDTLMKFFLLLNSHIDEEISNMVIDFYDRNYLCYPSSSQWTTNVGMLLDAFYTDYYCSLEVRLKVIDLMKSVYRIAKELCEGNFLKLINF